MASNRAALPSPLRSALRIVLAALATSAPLEAQGGGGPDGMPPGWRLDRWTTEHGLPGNFIADVVQSDDGFLWMLASGVLTRFDGVRFVPLETVGHPELRAVNLRALAAGRSDTIWLVTNRGQLVHHAGGSFGVSARAGQPLWAVAADPSGRVAAGSAGAMLWLRGDTLRPYPAVDVYHPSVFGERYYPQVRIDPAGRVWANGVKGLAVLEEGRVRTFPGTELPVLPVDLRSGEVLLAARAGDRVELSTPGEVRVASYPSAPRRVPRLVDREGRLWTTRPGVAEVFEAGEGGPPTLIPLGAGVNPGRLLQGREGEVWITTGKDGLLRIQRTPFVTVTVRDGAANRQVRAVAAGPSGPVALVAAGSRPYRVDGTPGTAVSVPGWPERAQAPGLHVDPRGTVWMAPPGELVGVPAEGGALRLRLEGIQDVASDVATPGVLWVLADRLHRVRPYGPDGPVSEALAVAGDAGAGRLVPARGGGVWVVRRTSVDRVGPGGVTALALPDSLLRTELRSLWEEPDGTVWLGTYGSGLIHWREGRATPVTSRDGLAEDVTSWIAADDDGMLWMAGNRSVHRASLDQLRAFAEGRAARVDGVAYGVRDGIDNPETSGRPGARDARGRLWFPTFGGAAVVDPGELARRERTPPTVVVEGVAVGDTVLAPAGTEVVLPRGRRELEVYFTSPSLRDGEDVRFEYRLAGVDEGWSRLGEARSARYAGVPGGSHRFEVRARSGAGVWSTEAAVLTLSVPRAFTETPWFPLLLASALVGASLLWVRRRTRVAEARARALEEVVRDRTEELRAAKAGTEQALRIVTEQRKELEELDEAKSRFFSNVTHELRTPITLMLGPLKDLGDGRLGDLPDDVAGEIELVRANGGRLLELVEQLLDIARLESGQMPLRPARGDLRGFLDRVVSPFGTAARERGVALDLRLDGVAGEAVFDADCVQKIVVNLLGNAFKFTPAGGTVRLVARTDAGPAGSRLLVEVSDTGRGIPEEELAGIFERFRRVDEREGTGVGGSGVGLSLVRELVHLLGGTVEVESREGEGSTFTVRLPLGAAPGEPVPDDGPRTSEEPVERRPTALVVEDHPDLRAYLRRHLEPAYHVLEAPDGLEALRLARETVPDVVISDVMMPGMDGEELCRRLKSDPDLDFVPVVMLTARASRENRISGLVQGADAYITKPFDVEELLLTISNQVEARRRFRERVAAGGGTLPALDLQWPGEADAATTRFIEGLHEVLRERLGDEDLNPEALASAMYMSRSTLYRRMEDVLGAPPMEVVWDFRLDQAAAWLAGTDGTVAEVAYAVGFKSVSHFSRRFAERFGTSPSAYRDA